MLDVFSRNLYQSCHKSIHMCRYTVPTISDKDGWDIMCNGHREIIVIIWFILTHYTYHVCNKYRIL